ncbi:hypothetical protein BDW22DRAFT_304285 [Trametopsis cervina]|nr:hypothetical protein BDW22DRAFT_304285 [Trametopsis cervina]
MAVVTCRVCNGKQFKDEEAYAQHARDNKTHQKKASVLLNSQHTVSSPGTPKSVQPAVLEAVQTGQPGYCKACKLDFGTEQLLQAHFSRGATHHHPRCLKCAKGFENHAVLEEHRKISHPLKYCAECRKFVYVEDWATHQLGNPKHSPPAPPQPPTLSFRCSACPAELFSTGALQQHKFATHTELCCFPCGSTYENASDLLDHYLKSVMHPTCEMCGIGFRDTMLYNQHLVSGHSTKIAPDVNPAGKQLSGSSPRSCGVCHRTFETAENLAEVQSHGTVFTLY